MTSNLSVHDFTRQSGLPDLKIADIVQDFEVLARAREAAFALVRRDPHLRQPEHAHLRERFEREHLRRGLGLARVG